MNQLAGAPNKSTPIYQLADTWWGGSRWRYLSTLLAQWAQGQVWRQHPELLVVFERASIIRAWKSKSSCSVSSPSTSRNVDGRGRAGQLGGCVEANSCVPLNLVLLLLLCLLSCGIRMVEDYERLFPWQPSLSNTVKYIVYVSQHQGIYVIPT